MLAKRLNNTQSTEQTAARNESSTCHDLSETQDDDIRRFTAGHRIEELQCTSTATTLTADPKILRFANKFPRLLSRTKKYRHLLPMLCLIVELHKYSTIYFSILFIFQFPPLLFDCIYLFTVFYLAVCVLIMCCAVWSYDH